MPVHRTSTMALSLHEEFSSLKAFKEAVKDWAINEIFDYCIKQNNSDHEVACCRKMRDTCPFRIRYNFKSEHDIAILLTLNRTHNYLGAAPISRSSPSNLSWFLDEIRKPMAVKKKTSARANVDCLWTHLHVKIRLQQARHVKWYLPKEDYGSYAESFQKVPEYLEKLRAKNASDDVIDDLVTKLPDDNNSQFGFLFVLRQPGVPML